MTKPALTTKQASAIIDCVIESGNYELPKPTDDDALLKSASEVIQSAEAARRAGHNAPAIIKVLDLASPLNNIPSLDTIEEATTATPTDDNDSSVDTAAISTDAKLMTRDQEKESTLIDLPTIPRDFSKVDDLQLRSLHAERHGILSKVIFELGLEESDYQSAQVAYEQHYKEAVSVAGGDKVTDRREEAFIDPDVTTWRQTVDNHHKKVIILRSYKELLESEIKGLSREYTMRTGERTATP